MKNIFIVVIDAFAYDILNRKLGGESVTPFLQEMMKHSMVAENMYSNAPYTEASLVSILGGERTLDNGGYLFGNRDVKKTIFSSLKDKGYTVLSQYSPYVYSKAYLRDVDEFWYTRLYSVRVLFTYRFNYYAEKKLANSLSDNDVLICQELLEEAFFTWNQQIDDLLSKDMNCILIQNWIDESVVLSVKEMLLVENEKYNNDKRYYLEELLVRTKDHILLKISDIYNNAQRILNKKTLKSLFEDNFVDGQKRYSRIIKKDKVDFKYLLNTFFVDGKRDFKGLLGAYRDYHSNKWLGSFFNEFNDLSKVEVGIRRQLDFVVERCKINNEEGKKCVSYVHAQDFHLPSVFYSFDLKDESVQQCEIKKGLEFLNRIDDNYKGNILADLGAYFIDCILESLFSKLKSDFANDFELIITADHGFPSLYFPPRPYIYNQTYKEAFHVPFIYYNGSDEGAVNKYCSLSQLKSIVCNGKIDDKESLGYVICEYAGPGCPDIFNREIWYTYIDDVYVVSVECKLNDNISFGSVKKVFDLQKDPLQKKNLIKDKSIYDKILYSIEKMQDRHLEIRNSNMKNSNS